MHRLFPVGILFLAALAGGCGNSDPQQTNPMPSETSKQYLAYFGTFTRGEQGGKGIYVSRFEVSSGRLSPIRLALEAEDPSYLAVHPNRRTLYSTNEVGGRSGTVSSYAIDPASGRLSLLNQVPAQGRGTCHIGLTGDGSMLAVVNYVTGSVATYQVLEDGRLGGTVNVTHNRGEKPIPIPPTLRRTTASSSCPTSVPTRSTSTGSIRPRRCSGVTTPRSSRSGRAAAPATWPSILPAGTAISWRRRETW